MRQLILYLFLIVITDPYQGIDYNKVNVYETNYCSGPRCNDKDPNYYHDYFREDDEYQSAYDQEMEEESEMRFIFPVDFPST